MTCLRITRVQNDEEDKVSDAKVKVVCFLH